MSNSREFARVFANKAKNMKEAEQQEKNETRKAVKNAQPSDASESLTNKLVQAKDYVSDKADEAKKFVEEKLEDITGQ
ncbi:hypothetical protein OESDEN_22961 [Oesophagostomum dentatum]|uniref:Uncharacterized protein n=1 Tax=Oesophagostomum dentatum TaxID=61180 RepID=A0A0B1RXK7_OESDE|nr:hypothetical protein OESDEN_22961 [Oesophagostomum dentatum]